MTGKNARDGVRGETAAKAAEGKRLRDLIDRKFKEVERKSGEIERDVRDIEESIDRGARPAKRRFRL